MPGRAAHQEAAAAAAAGGPEPTAAGGSAGAAAQQEQRGLAGAFPLVLKKLMENPPREARLGERGSARARGGGGGGGSARHPPASPTPPPSSFSSSFSPPPLPRRLPAPRLGGRDPPGHGGTGRGVRSGRGGKHPRERPHARAWRPPPVRPEPLPSALPHPGRPCQVPAARDPAGKGSASTGRPPACSLAASPPQKRRAAAAAPRAGSRRRAGATGKFSCCRRPVGCV